MKPGGKRTSATRRKQATRRSAAKRAAPAKRAPMRVFGCDPADWYNDPSHAFEVQFVSPPDKDQKLAIAKICGPKLRDGAAAFATEWLWNGEWALFFASARGNNVNRACAAVAKVFAAVDKKVPVAQLVFLGLRYHNTDGTPAPGPTWPTYDFLCDRWYERERFEPVKKPAVDKAFQTALKRA